MTMSELHLIVAARKGAQSLSSQALASCPGMVTAAVDFASPDNLRFGAFDALVGLTDELAKNDTQVEAVVRRLERQVLELDQKSQMMIVEQKSTLSIRAYLDRFQWNDSKFPRSRNISENLSVMLSMASKLDEEVRVKGAKVADLRAQLTAADKVRGAGVPLGQADLTFLLVPNKVRAADFPSTAHFKTAIVTVGKLGETDFLDTYSAVPDVVPGSALKLDFTDKDGAVLYRIVFMDRGSTAETDVRKEMRNARLQFREFELDEDRYAQLRKEHEHLQAHVVREEQFLGRLAAAAFSDAFVLWTHLKALRAFVESVLRYGISGKTDAALLRLKDPKHAGKVLQNLQAALPAHASETRMTAGGGDDEFYHFVSLPFQPLAQ